MLVLGACGGGDSTARRTDPGPRIERDVAAELAGRSDEVARLLESGDACGATAESGRLRDELSQAIDSGVIPEVYLEDLSGAVNDIEAQIPPCEVAQPPPPPQTPPPEEDEGDGKRNGDDKGKDTEEGNHKGKGKKGHDRDEGED